MKLVHFEALAERLPCHKERVHIRPASNQGLLFPLHRCETTLVCELRHRLAAHVQAWLLFFARRGLLLDHLRNEVDGGVLDELEELCSVTHQEFTNLLLDFFFLLTHVFGMHLTTVDPGNRVMRVEHLRQLSEDVLGDVDQEFGVDHLAQLVCLQVDSACHRSRRTFILE